MTLKVGDKVYIREGNGWGRYNEPSGPALVVVTRVIPDWNYDFDGKPVGGRNNWCYKSDEIITHSSRKRKGKLIGGYPIQ